MANDFTKGEWEKRWNKFDEAYGVYLNVKGQPHYIQTPICETVSQTNVDDASLIAAAGTCATKLAEMGLDAEKVLERLPEFLNFCHVNFGNGLAIHMEMARFLSQCEVSDGSS